ncbi:marine proteobacterial sortase target protein [Chelatococcus reniformis]|uniref:Marine proteobacterial sortase target protein n=1 Tax=Chelatococcus reniformis TaxID=1494448 RepID=A0A916XBD8_9HYPH|nr:marine proteobacterial sortase target protein [Chelatococcus reniformis]GGC59250.1 marine proteobacterial sortase target protein [Chelatococcus reniformis]
MSIAPNSPGARASAAGLTAYPALRLASLASAAAAAGIAVVAFFAASPGARATNPPPPVPSISPDTARSGSLLVKTSKGYIEAIRVDTDVDIAVSGPTARARVTQVFRNPTDGWIEGVYVYPLSDGSAVDSMKMVVGKRVIVADIAERKKAREVYEAARADGRKAALTEQERPNIFTNSVANIGPGESVVVQIEYQEPVRQADGRFSLKVPLVVAPRYNPAPVAQQVRFDDGGSGWGSDPVPDRARIEPPVTDPRTDPPDNPITLPVTLTVRLAAGFPLAEVASATHQVTVEQPAPDTRTVALAGPVPADRDFELTWTPTASKLPSVGLFRERVGKDDYLLAFVTPPAVDAAAAPKARDVTFVIDNSGSMGGPSMQQAKASLIYALDRLRPADRFNVIRFDDTMTRLFDDTVPADAEHLGQAKAFVLRLEASGGTEMLAPLKAALSDTRPHETSHLRQVVFLTDGAIGNEQQIFEAIARTRGRSRLFMVGIGSAPNGYLMRRAAELGRGTFTAISTGGQVQERMQALVQKLENPAVTDIEAQLSTADADLTPGSVPDLYRGEPLVLAAKLGKGGAAGTLAISGRIGDTPWSLSLPIDKAAAGRGLSKVWARRKIDDAEVARAMNRMTQDEADKAVLALALDHHLVTRLTSLVAVDKTPSRALDVPLTRADVPLELPAGWDFDKVFGPAGEPGPERRAPVERRAEHGDPDGIFDARRVARPTRPLPPRGAVVAAVASPSQGVVLPTTATDAELRLMAGLVLLGLGLAVLASGAGRRRRPA